MHCAELVAQEHVVFVFQKKERNRLLDFRFEDTEIPRLRDIAKNFALVDRIDRAVEIGIGRRQHADDIRPLVADAVQQADATSSRHALVGDH